MLPSHAADLAERFGLGTASTLVGPVAFGRVGEVWRLETDRGVWAVKTWSEAPDVREVERDTAYQERFAAAGIPLPPVVRAPDGAVLAHLDGAPVRVHGWVDVADEDRALDPVAVGRLLAAMHRVDLRAEGPVDAWFTDPVGADGWASLVAQLRLARAPFADRLAAVLPDVLAAEAMITAPVDLRVCHRDLWADNLRARTRGGLVALDWETAGPADPNHELAVVAYEYGLGQAARIGALHAAYVDAGGPGRLRSPGDLSMLQAQLGHIVREGCRRWLDATTDDDRADNEAWVGEFLDDPITPATVELMLDAVREKS